MSQRTVTTIRCDLCKTEIIDDKYYVAHSITFDSSSDQTSRNKKTEYEDVCKKCFSALKDVAKGLNKLDTTPK